MVQQDAGQCSKIAGTKKKELRPVDPPSTATLRFVRERLLNKCRMVQKHTGTYSHITGVKKRDLTKNQKAKTLEIAVRTLAEGEYMENKIDDKKPEQEDLSQMCQFELVN